VDTVSCFGSLCLSERNRELLGRIFPNAKEEQNENSRKYNILSIYQLINHQETPSPPVTQVAYNTRTPPLASSLFPHVKQ
jgi:hypothetical protein